MENQEEKKPETIEILSLERLQEEFDKIYLLEDRNIVKIACATIVANRMSLDPVWLLLVGPSASGKTEAINAFSDLSFLFPISTLTVNTFASGQERKGKETSLLMKMNNGILTFKDFTTIISMNKDARKEIMSQLREIYDGDFVKRTGTGKDVVWKGKVGVIAGATPVVYEYLAEMSAMGDRFVMYSIVQPNRREVSKRVLKNATDMSEKRLHIRKCTASYINFVLSHLYKEEVVLTEEIKEELLTVADFSTQVRSAVITNDRTGNIEYVPSPEMPMRVMNQLYTIASAFAVMKKAEMTEQEKEVLGKNSVLTLEDMQAIYKIAFDSIPHKRRMALQLLATYKYGVTTAGIAATLNYPTETVRKWLFQLNGLKICSRDTGSGRGDKWLLGDQYRDIMVKFEKVKVLEESLDASDPTPEDENWDSDDSMRKIEEFNKRVAEREREKLI